MAKSRPEGWIGKVLQAGVHCKQKAWRRVQAMAVNSFWLEGRVEWSADRFYPEGNGEP